MIFVFGCGIIRMKTGKENPKHQKGQDMQETNLKETLTQAEEHYERHAEWLRKRMEAATSGSRIQRETRDAYEFNRGRAKAMREALEFVESFIG